MRRTRLGWKDLASRVTRDVRELRRVLGKGLDPNLRGDGGETLLHVAAALESPASLRLLLDRGADPNAADDKGRTPLHTACGSGDLPTVRRLSAGLPLPAPSVADRLLPPAGPGLLLLPARAAGGGR